MNMMDDDPITRALEIRMRTARIVFWAFVGSLGIYALLVYLVLQGGKPKHPPTLDPLFRNMLYVLAVAMQLGLKYLKANALDASEKRATDSASYHAVKQTNMIIGLAFSECPAIYGLLLFFMSFDPQHYAILASYSLFLMFVRRPDWSEWEAEVRQLPHSPRSAP
jgi:F0F1-type ATP synthase membrane subunit c/vacuolar-type H+-ATPase subunit K